MICGKSMFQPGVTVTEWRRGEWQKWWE